MIGTAEAIIVAALIIVFSPVLVGFVLLAAMCGSELAIRFIDWVTP